MIKKRDLKKIIKQIEVLINDVAQLEGPIYFTPMMLNEVILILGKQPVILPTMSMSQIPDEDKWLDLSNTTLRNCCVADLRLIRAMLIGIYNNYTNYTEKNKIMTFANNAFTTLTPIVTQAFNSIKPFLYQL